MNLNFKLWLEAQAELIEDPIMKGKYAIVGNTYTMRDQLGDLGCQFDYQLKQWKIYNPNQTALDALHRLGVIIPPNLLGEAKGTIKLIQKDGRYILVGHTWPIKNTIKNIGFKWDSLSKKWWRNKLTPKVIQELDKLGISHEELIQV